MVKDEITKRSLDMAKSVIRRLILRGAIADRADAERKIADRVWLHAEGYEAVANLLSGGLGQQACNQLYDEMACETKDT